MTWVVSCSNEGARKPETKKKRMGRARGLVFSSATRTTCKKKKTDVGAVWEKREFAEGNKNETSRWRFRGARLARACERLVIPSTKQMASRMLLLPEPFRPVMALNRGSNAGTTVRCA